MTFLENVLADYVACWLVVTHNEQSFGRFKVPNCFSIFIRIPPTKGQECKTSKQYLFAYRAALNINNFYFHPSEIWNVIFVPCFGKVIGLLTAQNQN
jgi:hypothetical protein